MKSTNAISMIGRMPAIAAPVAMPMKPVSEIGVSITRWAPNSSGHADGGAEHATELRATSSPMTKMFEVLAHLGDHCLAARASHREGAALIGYQVQPCGVPALCVKLFSSASVGAG